MKKYRFLIARRFTQLSISLVLQTVPLSDPFAVLQMIFAGAIISFDIFLQEL